MITHLKLVKNLQLDTYDKCDSTRVEWSESSRPCPDDYFDIDGVCKDYDYTFKTCKESTTYCTSCLDYFKEPWPMMVNAHVIKYIMIMVKKFVEKVILNV